MKLISVVHYPIRGPYGDRTFRGNTSGLLVKDLLEFYRPSRVVDPMEGSGTTGDVCKELGISYTGLDLLRGNDLLDPHINQELRADFIFWHPPYWNIVEYSKDIRDLSTEKRYENYLVKLLQCYRKLADYLEWKGHLAILIGKEAP